MIRTWLWMLAWFFCASSAWSADKAQVSLVHSLAPGASGCPDADTLRRLVAAELGYDPFVENSADVVEVRFAIEEEAAVAILSRTAPGQAKRERRLVEGDCGELGASVAFAVALQIDPSMALAGPRGVEAPLAKPAVTPRLLPSPTLSASPPTDVAPAPDVPPAVTAPLYVAIAAGLAIGGGLVPGVSIGPEIGAALEGDFWSVGLSVLGILPGEQETSSGRVSASVVRGNLTPCLSTHFIPELSGSVCANFGLGALFGEASDVTRATPTTELHAVLGPKVALSIEPWESFGFRVGALVDVALSRVHLVIDDHGEQREIWATPAVAALGDVAAVVRFR